MNANSLEQLRNELAFRRDLGSTVANVRLDELDALVISLGLGLALNLALGFMWLMGDSPERVVMVTAHAAVAAVVLATIIVVAA